MGNLSQKSPFSSSHFRETKHRSWEVHFDTEWIPQSNFLSLELGYLCLKPGKKFFATNVNAHFSKYVAFRPDSGTMYIGTFIIDWDHLNFFAFSIISVIPRALPEVKQDSAEGIIIILLWPTQFWYPAMLTIYYRLRFCSILWNHCFYCHKDLTS